MKQEASSASFATGVSPIETLDVIKEDTADNRILECAAAANSDFIITEDKDLLRLGQYGNSRIVTIRDFIKLALSRRVER